MKNIPWIPILLAISLIAVAAQNAIGGVNVGGALKDYCKEERPVNADALAVLLIHKECAEKLFINNIEGTMDVLNEGFLEGSKSGRLAGTSSADWVQKILLRGANISMAMVEASPPGKITLIASKVFDYYEFAIAILRRLIGDEIETPHESYSLQFDSFSVFQLMWLNDQYIDASTTTCQRGNYSRTLQLLLETDTYRECKRTVDVSKNDFSLYLIIAELMASFVADDLQPEEASSQRWTGMFEGRARGLREIADDLASFGEGNRDVYTDKPDATRDVAQKFETVINDLLNNGRP